MSESNEQTAVRALAATPPWRFSDARSAHARIQEIETILGIQHSPIITNVRGFNARHQELAALLALKAATPAPAPVAIVAPKVATGSDIIAQYEAITDPCDRVSFYRENKRSIDRAYRDAPPKKVARKLTGQTLIDEMYAIEDGAKCTAFYRANKAAIDAYYLRNSR